MSSHATADVSIRLFSRLKVRSLRDGGPACTRRLAAHRSHPSSCSGPGQLATRPPAYWEKVVRATWDDLLGMEDPQGPLWIDGHSTSKGCNDRVPLSLTHDISSPLRLLQVDGLPLSVFKPGKYLGNPKPLRQTPTTPVRHYGFQRIYQNSE